MRANGLWDEDLNCAKDGAAVTFDQYLAAALHAQPCFKSQRQFRRDGGAAVQGAGQCHA